MAEILETFNLPGVIPALSTEPKDSRVRVTISPCKISFNLLQEEIYNGVDQSDKF